MAFSPAPAPVALVRQQLMAKLSRGDRIIANGQVVDHYGLHSTVFGVALLQAWPSNGAALARNSAICVRAPPIERGARARAHGRPESGSAAMTHRFAPSPCANVDWMTGQHSGWL